MKFKPKELTVTTEYPQRWGRVNDALRLFPLGRTELYRLIGLGEIKSYVYRTPAGIKGKGIRVIDLDSIAELLEKMSKEAK